jgi:class 3 adenylate cyclase
MWQTVAASLLIVGVFVGGYLYTTVYPPLAQVDAQQLQAMAVINMLAGFVILTAVMSYVTATAERAEADLSIEHRKSEALLNNVMPTAIAARLKQGATSIAENFPDASVLFADLVGFTPLAQRLRPDQLLDLLDGLFSCFDELVDKYGLEKIKTVGDAYMVAAGIPVPRPDHAEAIANLALDMRAASISYSQSRGVPLHLRLGISSGAVVAGVIGKRRFLYDLWGDSVNTAARMEEQGRSDEIQVSEATEHLLRGKFVLKERGIVEIKGKGPMRTYWLEGGLTREQELAQQRTSTSRT